jgi:protein-tyrosine phosphatase
VTGFVDLHCHWVHQIDDGARNTQESKEMLLGLRDLGFDHVVATPHMRPGMFDNDRSSIQAAYRRTRIELEKHDQLPSTSLGSEHFFNDQVLLAIRNGRGLPYRRETEQDPEAERHGGAVLLEFHDLLPLSIIHRQLFQLQTAGYIVVLAHPERYRATWDKPQIIEDCIERGAVTLLDTAALIGKYGRRPQAAARELLAEGLYHAACSDAHRPSDIALVQQGMAFIVEHYGQEELELLLGSGPRALLSGKRPSL